MREVVRDAVRCHIHSGLSNRCYFLRTLRFVPRATLAANFLRNFDMLLSFPLAQSPILPTPLFGLTCTAIRPHWPSTRLIAGFLAHAPHHVQGTAPSLVRPGMVHTSGSIPERLSACRISAVPGPCCRVPLSLCLAPRSVLASALGGTNLPGTAATSRFLLPESGADLYDSIVGAAVPGLQPSSRDWPASTVEGDAGFFVSTTRS